MKLTVLKAAVGTLTFCALIGVAFLIGPVIEYKFMPVVTNVSVHFLGKAEHESLAKIAVSANKVRHCKLDEIEARTTLPSGENVRASIYFKDPATGKYVTDLVTRPVGTQSFDVWYVFPGVGTVQVYSRHRCHVFWDSITDLFTIKIA